jgi:formate dehydrogenase subunit gamma
VSERLAHWLLALAFAVMLATGLFIGGIGPVHHSVVLAVHVGAAVVLLAGIAVLLASRSSRRSLAQLARDLRRISPSDWRWIRLAPRAYATGAGTEALPPSGRFNGGQKVNARLVLLVLTVLYVSGVGELARRTSSLKSLGVLSAPHGLAAGVAAALVAGHVYLALLHRETRPSMRGITRGSVRRDWAEGHHAEWVADEDKRRLHDQQG